MIDRIFFFTSLLPLLFLFSFLECLCLRSVRQKKKSIPDLGENILLTALSVPHHARGEPHAGSLMHTHVYVLHLHTQTRVHTEELCWRNHREDESSLFAGQGATQKHLKREKGVGVGRGERMTGRADTALNAEKRSLGGKE